MVHKLSLLLGTELWCFTHDTQQCQAMYALVQVEVDQAVQTGVVQSAIVTKRCCTDDIHATGSLVETWI